MDKVDQLSALMASTDIGARRVNLKSGNKGEVLIGFPRDGDPRVWDALPPKDFEAKHGPIMEQDLPHLLILVKDQNGNYAPSVLFDKTITDPDGKQVAWKEQVKQAAEKLREWGVPVDFNPKRVKQGTWQDGDETKPRYKLEGESQGFDTPGGLRMRKDEYENPMATGALAPDLLLHDRTRGVIVFRHKNDGLHSIGAMKYAHGYPHAALKSTGNFYHDENYINARGWNTAEHRFNGYLQEGRIKDLDDVMVGMPNGRMFSASLVMRHLPDSLEGRKLRHGPNEHNKHIPINVKDKWGNTFIPIEEASVSFPRHLAGMVDTFGMHKGAWAETQIKDGRTQLTPAAKSEMFDKYRNAPNAMVATNGVLYPVHDADVKARGAEFTKSYPPDQQYAFTVGRKGGRNGSMRNIASMTRDAIPHAAVADIAEMSKQEASSRFAPDDRSQPSRAASPSPHTPLPAEQDQAHHPYATPDPTPAVSRFANIPSTQIPAPHFGAGSAGQGVQFQPNITPGNYSARSDLIESRRGSNASMEL